MDTYNSDKLDNYAEGKMNNSMDICNSDELYVINRQKNELTFDDQKSADEYNLIFDTQSIASESSLVYNNQEDILENSKIIDEVDEFQSDNSESEIDSADYSESEIDSADFPSTAYQDFIDIVIRYNLSYMASDAVLKFIKRYGQISKKILSRSTKDGLLFLNTLRKDHTKFYLTPILRYQEITENCIFDYQEVYTLVEGRQERLFSEFYNSKWWGRAQQHISPGNKVLPIILYSDATTLDCLEKSSRHPIFISLSNIPTTVRNKAKAKALVGIIPTLRGTKEERQTPQFRQLIRSVFYKCINILIEPLCSQYHSGVTLKVNNYKLRCNMMLASIIGNWSENCKSCLTYSGASCARPCHTCFVEKDDLNVINLPANHKITRTEIQMKQAIEMGQGKDHSLYEETNSFWNHLVNKFYKTNESAGSSSMK
ncbi:21856_t:CDS:2 [Dentiscutata erythropus]|uniref:21856_t:CDS:1 n=1 Tax=Dentiscutata erythropus TaxID=1348616 RepID=A0A9N9D235_9GLOM|nr:21856_t:CDS:2 [Dentiscutata erythropus]